MKIGQKLLIRKGSTVVVKSAAAPTDSTSTVTPTDSLNTNEVREPIVVNKDTATVTPVAPIIRTHIVKKGDTLSSIARQYGTTAAALASYNHLSNINAIQIGQKIKIPQK